MRLVYLAAGESLAAGRAGQRRGHYFPASLIPSQFAALEPPAPQEQAIEIDAEWPTARQVSAVVADLPGPCTDV
ncbi:MAG: hypothetical protein JSS35_13410 [Proteobacteria bacterium]|nr:hypothetical protein [Pseudomonadota bacterium]